VLLAANELKKDIWINVPITASGPYGGQPSAGRTHSATAWCVVTSAPRLWFRLVAVTGTNTPSDKTKTYVYQLALLFRDGMPKDGGPTEIEGGGREGGRDAVMQNAHARSGTFAGNQYTNNVGLDPSLNIYIEHCNQAASGMVPVP
jgi:hypothetical protein